MFDVPNLDDDALVVRGGLMRIPTLRYAVDLCKVRHDFYGLSFFGENDASLDAITRAAGSRLENGQIRMSTVGRMREVGFEPYRSGEYPHLSVEFQWNPSDDDLERLVAVFDEPIPNPLKAT